ncbi:MAG: DUF3021 family protein [Clostridia bacterium]|nr:DUF3021 family protein [Clostridia bacterium]HCA55020.1 hypothetical protein [Oscillospiraceae bacterium]
MDRKSLLKRLRTYGISCCVSYTLVSLILSALNRSENLIAGDIWRTNLQLLSVCAVIALLMFITDTLLKQEENSFSLPGFMLGLADVAAPVLIMGGLVFHWFSFSTIYILIPIGILLVVYLATFALFYINAKLTEKELNRKIHERKERLQHDKQND